MRRRAIVHISKCCEKFVKKNLLNSEGYALRIYFSEFIGPKLSKYAQLVKISRDSLYISVKSPVVKNEILLLRRKIIKTVNEFLGHSNESKSVIKKIIIL